MPRQRGITARRWAHFWVRRFMQDMINHMQRAHRYDLVHQFRRIYRELYYQMLDSVFDMARDGIMLPRRWEDDYVNMVDDQVYMIDQGQGLDPATPEISE